MPFLMFLPQECLFIRHDILLFSLCFLFAVTPALAIRGARDFTWCCRRDDEAKDSHACSDAAHFTARPCHCSDARECSRARVLPDFFFLLYFICFISLIFFFLLLPPPSDLHPTHLHRMPRLSSSMSAIMRMLMLCHYAFIYRYEICAAAKMRDARCDGAALFDAMPRYFRYFHAPLIDAIYLMLPPFIVDMFMRMF